MAPTDMYIIPWKKKIKKNQQERERRDEIFVKLCVCDSPDSLQNSSRSFLFLCLSVSHTLNAYFQYYNIEDLLLWMSHADKGLTCTDQLSQREREKEKYSSCRLYFLLNNYDMAAAWKKKEETDGLVSYISGAPPSFISLPLWMDWKI